MKKIIIILTVGLLLAAFAIYKVQKSNKAEESNLHQSEETSESITHSKQNKTASKEKKVIENKEENKKLTQSIPMNQFEGMTSKEIKQQLKQDGAENIEINSEIVSFTMPQNVYQQKINEMHRKIGNMIQQINSKDHYTSIQNIVSDDNYSKVKITVDRASYEDSFDSIAVFSLMAAITYYYNYQGNKQFKITVEYIDATTNEKFAEESYPQADK